MQCTSLYPCPPEKAGINVISEMKNKYKRKYKYGFSDHTQGSEAAVLAMSFGAKVFEKHLTFSTKMYGSDAKFAMEPHEFSQYVQSLKKTHKILKNQVNKDKFKLGNNMKKVFEKKIILNFSKKKGHVIKEKDLILRKSKDGLFASQIDEILGKKLKKSLKSKSPIKKNFLY